MTFRNFSTLQSWESATIRRIVYLVYEYIMNKTGMLLLVSLEWLCGGEDLPLARLAI